MTTQELERQAKEIMAYQTCAELLDIWEMTTENSDPTIPTIRGWLMDEFESRNPEGFEKWLNESAEDNELRYYI